MNYKVIIGFICFFSASLINAQKKDDVLVTVDNENITVSEFLKVYNKNLDLVKDADQKDIENYLNLFINYKLKLAEARRLELDKSPLYLKEFGNYKKQLIRNFISENKATDALVKEAYDRMNYDIKAIHILIKDDIDKTDTLEAYNQILKYRDQLISDGFDSTKNALHNGNTIFVEDLGYFSTFKMVYDFETAAYNTKVGDVSMPFKTQFGYHVVKVLDKRPSRGNVTVGHIMISEKQKDSTIVPKERAELIYEKLMSGESFDALAKQFSDDKSSARNGGKLAPFKSGQLNSPTFEDAAFALKSVGDFTKPIITQYGYHIIKLLEKEPIPKFEEAKANLESQVQRDSRSKLINSAMADELQKRYKVTEKQGATSYFKSFITSDYFSGKLDLPSDFDGDETLITINEKVLYKKDFVSHLKSVQRRYFNKPINIESLIDNEYKEFLENKLLEYREEHLEQEDEKFADILKEYRDGLLLFDLMEKQIWNKASKDTIGLKEFYETNTSNYMWAERADIFMASASNKEEISKIKQLLEKETLENEIRTTTENNENNSVIFTKGIFELSDSIFPVNFNFETGISNIIYHNATYHVMRVNEIIPSQIKPLDETKGAVINDYQSFLESQWLKELKGRYSIKINKKVFDALK